MRAASYLLMPSLGRKLMRIRGGLGKDLIMEINTRWETAVWDGSYEVEVQQLFAKYLREGMTFYDIGGGLGFYSMVAARLGADVIVFEPATSNAALISRHAKINGLENRIRIVHSAVFSYSGAISLQSNERETGHRNFSVQPQDQATTELTRVSCITLDDFIKDNPRPDFLKIDVESAESEVLKGAKTLFSTIRPPLVCEIHDEANAASVTHWLDDNRYHCSWLVDRSSFPCFLYAVPLS